MKSLKVFKFGGASIKDADAIRNVANILDIYKEDNILVVISAMGKTTNLLEELIEAYWANNQSNIKLILERLFHFHNEIINDLGISSKDQFVYVYKVYDELKIKVNSPKSDNYHFEYDQLVSFGELLSTTIIAAFLDSENHKTLWLDARSVIRTNNSYRDARINWDKTQELYNEKLKKLFNKESKIVITQGFIGRTAEGMTTTLGREGSDFTASIFAYVSGAKDVTIWKDVPGMLNADPRHFESTVLLSKISFTEAVELAYYGASVIHPKTIQPLKKKEIPLYIKSFINPKESGTIIQSSTKYDSDVPSYIFKEDQILISITPKDFSFVVEDQLTEIFSLLSEQQVRMNLMQNSAVSFSFLIDNRYRINELIDRLEKDYFVKCDSELELLTIRHYNENTIQRLAKGKSIVLIQKTEDTARVILR